MKIKEWNDLLNPVLSSPEMQKVKAEVAKKREETKVWPEGKNTMNAFKATPYQDVKVVILGQDPYPSMHAHGLAFSSLASTTPESLKNIFTEIYESLYKERGLKYEECFPTNDLSSWAKDGVFLYNTVLTVEENKPASHKDIGWDFLTEKVMEALNDHDNSLIFLLWGNHAKSYKRFITDKKHTVLESTHPSPMSYEKGFKGCGHFKKVDDIFCMGNEDRLTIDLRKYFYRGAADEEITNQLKAAKMFTEEYWKLVTEHLDKKVEWMLDIHIAKGFNWKTRILT